MENQPYYQVTFKRHRPQDEKKNIIYDKMDRTESWNNV